MKNKFSYTPGEIETTVDRMVAQRFTSENDAAGQREMDEINIRNLRKQLANRTATTLTND